MGILAPMTLADSTAPFADAATSVWGTWAGACRCRRRRGLVPGRAQRLDPASRGKCRSRRRKTDSFRRSSRGCRPREFPTTGLVISSVLITGLMATNYSQGLVSFFTFMILLATLSALIPYAFTAMAELMIYLREPELFSGVRLGRSAVLAGLAFVYSIWAIGGSGRDTVFWGFLLLLCGIPVYVWIEWRETDRR